ncbi:hypothetical protein [Pseudomarimonas arenosa]|uniref:Nucleoside-diphosphate-sugar epimerase n=1 Tax=Pseudomarimonas arenosa TaxID=2774145 RepID=A0AAW3ZMR0_9GAMM|nr:hypothetical protein [Pseudomarimonas arenosa]MBD8525591.1 hypothetical protein [Pseudomarimonas arenosa]
MNILIGGLGDLGRRCARLWSAAGHTVIGLKRRPQIDPGEGWQTLAADMAALQPGQFDQVELALFCASPDQRSESAYQACYFEAAAAFMASVPAAARRLLVSSSAPIEGADGQWVDEDQHCPAERWNGKLLAAAERQLRRSWPALCVLMPSGLYGPGRNWLLRRVLAGETGGGRYTHRIHIDDCARAVVHLSAQTQRAPRYLLTDDAPLPEWQVMAGLAEMLGQTPARRGPVAEGRRLSNRRLHASGFRLHYPDFRRGYRDLLSSAGPVNRQQTTSTLSDAP